MNIDSKCPVYSLLKTRFKSVRDDYKNTATAKWEASIRVMASSQVETTHVQG